MDHGVRQVGQEVWNVNPGGQAVGSVGTCDDNGPWSGFMSAYAESDVGAGLARLREEGRIEGSRGTGTRCTR